MKNIVGWEGIRGVIWDVPVQEEGACGRRTTERSEYKEFQIRLFQKGESTKMARGMFE